MQPAYSVIHDLESRRPTPQHTHKEDSCTPNISPDDMEKEAYEKLLKLCNTFETCDRSCDKCKDYVIDVNEGHKKLMKWRDSL